MKALIVLVVVVLLGAGAWWYLSSANSGSPNSAYATTEAFMEAAVNDDQAALEGLCAESARTGAARAAQLIRTDSNATRLKFDLLENREDKALYSATVSGKVVEVKLEKTGEAFRITDVRILDL